MTDMTRSISYLDALSLAQRQRIELHLRIGCKAYRAAVLEFGFSAAICRSQSHTLCDWHVLDGFFKPAAGVAVDLHGAVNVAQADDACIGIGECHPRQQQRRNDCNWKDFSTEHTWASLVLYFH